jgi:hypothetical protein
MTISNSLLIQSLDLNVEWANTLLKQDKKLMKEYRIAILAIKNGKYRNNKKLQQMKLTATKNDFTEVFINRYLMKKSIIIKIITDAIKEYFVLNNNKCYCFSLLCFCINKRTGEYIR